jgi:hypothetical protein
MANDFSAVIPKILAQGLKALRENAIMPLLVNRTYETEAAEKGATVDVPLPSAITDVDVAPSAVAPDPGDTAPTTVPIPLDKWREASFQMSDKDILEAINDTVVMQVSEAAKALGNYVDNQILANYVDIYGTAGSEGVTPFSSGDTTDATDARKVLNTQLAPMEPRFGVLDPDAEASALNLRAFQDYSWNQDLAAIRDGRIEKRLGSNWFMDQNIPTHTAGAASGYTVTGAHSVGAETIVMGVGSGGFLAGDIITFAGQTQTYTVVADQATPASGVAISPSLAGALSGGEAVTSLADHVVNLNFHRDCFALATRPLASAEQGTGVQSMTTVDPVTGLPLRLEVVRENKRTRWSFDILFGTATVRPELGCRLLG